MMLSNQQTICHWPKPVVVAIAKGQFDILTAKKTEYLSV